MLFGIQVLIQRRDNGWRRKRVRPATGSFDVFELIQSDTSVLDACSEGEKMRTLLILFMLIRAAKQQLVFQYSK